MIRMPRHIQATVHERLLGRLRFESADMEDEISKAQEGLKFHMAHIAGLNSTIARLTKDMQEINEEIKSLEARADTDTSDSATDTDSTRAA